MSMVNVMLYTYTYAVCVCVQYYLGLCWCVSNACSSCPVLMSVYMFTWRLSFYVSGCPQVCDDTGRNGLVV